MPASRIAEIDLRFLSDFLGDAQVGKSAFAYVVDPRGVVLASSAKGPDVGKDVSTLPQVAALMTPGGRPLASGTDTSGQSVLTTSNALPKLGWFVLFEQPTAQALAPIRDQLVRIALLIALGLAVAILAGIVLARRMLIPITALRSGARKLGDGDFSHRIEVRTRDELEELADQFNSMAGQLQETYSGLETKVEERTRDLARSINELKVLEEVGRAVASSLDLNAVLPTVAARALEITHADAVLIYGYDAAKQQFNLTESIGIDKAAEGNHLAIDQGGSVLGQAAESGEPIAIPDLDDAADHLLRDVAVAAGFHSVLVVPLVDQKGILGSLVVLRQNAGEFSPNLIGLMKTFAHQSVLAMRNARLFTEVDHKGRELATAHSTVQQQATKLQEQTDELKHWNRSLEERVEKQLAEIERIRRLERFLAPQVAQLIASSDGHEGLLDSHRREVTVVFCDLQRLYRVHRDHRAGRGDERAARISRRAGRADLPLRGHARPLCRRRRDDPVQRADPVRGSHAGARSRWRSRCATPIGALTAEVAQPRAQSRLRRRHRARLCHARPDRLRAAAGIRRDRQRHQPRLAAVRRSQGQPDRGQPARVRHGRAMGRRRARSTI